MVIGLLYDKKITANTLRGLKMKASKIANNYFNPIDVMKVYFEKKEFNFIRRNKVYPNNTIEYGKWR